MVPATLPLHEGRVSVCSEQVSWGHAYTAPTTKQAGAMAHMEAGRNRIGLRCRIENTTDTYRPSTPVLAQELLRLVGKGANEVERPLC